MKKILFFLAALLAATTAFQAHALSSGNAVAPSPKRLLLTYNILNLPHTATLRDADNNVTAFVTYGYLADGPKVSAAPDSGQDPGDDIVIDPSDTLAVLPFRDVWHIKDHLGNVRVAVDISVNIPEPGVIERSDYLPFGTRVEHGVFDSCNLWRFAAKEEQRFGSAAGSLSAGLSADLALLDFGARYLDPFTARWTTSDPMASKYPGVAPYAYCGGDPVNRVDPDGNTDYFSKEGIFLFKDNLDNGEIRITSQEAIDNSKVNFGENYATELYESESISLNNALSLGVISPENTDATLFNIINHFNDTEYPLSDTGANPDAQFTARNDGQYFSVIIHCDVRKCLSAGFFDNSYNLINAINGHEKYHANGISKNYSTYKNQSSEQHEIDAVNYQMNHLSWNKTTKKFKKQMIGIKEKILKSK